MILSPAMACRRYFTLVWLLILVAGWWCGKCISAQSTPPSKRNLLFVIGESMRPDDLESYGGIPGLAPNFERLFKRRGSIIVDQAHVDYPMCNPSRASVLLGRNPDVTGVKTNFLDWRKNPMAKTWQSLPMFLKNQGYLTLSGGKVFHRGTNDVAAWTRIFQTSDDINQAECFQDPQAKPVNLDAKTLMPESIGCKTVITNLVDLNIGRAAVTELTKYANQVTKNKTTQPFAMFIGFHLPHFPIHVNKQFLIDHALVAPLIPVDEPPRNMSLFLNDYSFDSPKPIIANELQDPDRSQIPGSIRQGDTFSGPGPDQIDRQSLRWLHISGVQQVDQGLGMVLDALDTNGLTSNTLIVFYSDHAVALGETRLFDKDMPLDIATRIPLAINMPWMSESPSVHTGTKFLMNSVDLYRTIAGYLGLRDQVDRTVNGADQSNYFTSLSLASAQKTLSNMPPPESRLAYSQVVRCSNPLKWGGTLQGVDVVGYTARSESYRYIVYLKANNGQVTDFSPSSIISEELYDHSNDDMTIFNTTANFIGHEMNNVVRRNRDLATQFYQAVSTNFVAIRDSVQNPTSMPSTSPSPAPSALPTSLSPTTGDPDPGNVPTAKKTKRPTVDAPARRTKEPTDSSPAPTTSPTSTPSPSTLPTSPTLFGDTLAPSSQPPAPASATPTSSPHLRGASGDAPTSTGLHPGEIQGNSETANPALVAGVVVPLVLVSALGYWIIRKRRSKSQQQPRGSSPSAPTPDYDEECASRTISPERKDTRTSVGDSSSSPGPDKEQGELGDDWSDAKSLSQEAELQ